MFVDEFIEKELYLLSHSTKVVSDILKAVFIRQALNSSESNK